MKYLLLIIFILFISTSCDPGYTISIINRSKYDKEILLKQYRCTIEYRVNKEDSLDIGKRLKIDSIIPDQFNRIVLPINQSIIVQGVGIVMPRGESVIIGNDTIKYFQTMKKFSFTNIKHYYIIK